MCILRGGKVLGIDFLFFYFLGVWEFLDFYYWLFNLIFLNY